VHAPDRLPTHWEAARSSSIITPRPHWNVVPARSRASQKTLPPLAMGPTRPGWGVVLAVQQSASARICTCGPLRASASLATTLFTMVTSRHGTMGCDEEDTHICTGATTMAGCATRCAHPHSVLCSTRARTAAYKPTHAPPALTTTLFTAVQSRHCPRAGLTAASFWSSSLYQPMLIPWSPTSLM
jgi:hypothetical protein